ncbi:hypothetical protein SJI19_16605 [Acerihabitans sp. TG2]|uniref:hypothetical protein n=1 Tax=Acerihabitans sp. TG2 TaxID=3096008 RepID=UPI002B23264E|nr:hypothetical protein [Acerihabitans sp. TG2]MEA9392146.1 hypothetical protein [Acerihabitans sp. TG2]
MNCYTLRLACLGFALLLPLAKPVFASTNEGAGESSSIAQGCPECVSFDVSVWKFTPTRPDALKNIIHSLKGLSGDGLGDGDGQRVISPGQSAIVADMFRQAGALERLLYWQAVSVQGESVPMESVSRSGNFSAVLKINGVTSSPVVTSSLRDLAPPALLNFSYKADQPGNSSSGFNTFAGSGRVLLRNGGALLNINRQEHCYLIWLVRVAY